MSNEIETFFDKEKMMVGGALMYACIKSPSKKYKSEEREFKVSVVVDEDSADEWNEMFSKQPAKVVLTKNFEEIYKVPAPLESKKQFVITLRKDVLLANGQPVPDVYKPKVFLQKEDGKLLNVTLSKEVGNGSLGVVSIETYDAGDYGVFARLKNVKVTSLVEYESNHVEAGSEFGNEIESEGAEFETKPEGKPEKETKAEKVASKKPAGKPKKTQEPASDDSDDDAPF